MLPSKIIKLFHDSLLSGSPKSLRQLHLKGELTSIIPAWERMTGEANTQHKAHDFPLDEHTLRVVEGTKASDYYAHLAPREQRWVAMAALLHDIGKNGGPAHLRDEIPVDRAHPSKSAEMIFQILPTLGYTSREIDRIAVLIEYHQLFGFMIMTHQTEPSPEKLEQAALKLRYPSAVPMLRALSEGDIKGVREGGALFNTETEHKLAWFSGLVEGLVTQYHQHTVFLPQHPLEFLQPGLNDIHCLEHCYWVSLPYTGDLFTKPSSIAQSPFYQGVYRQGVPIPGTQGWIVDFLPENIAALLPQPIAIENLQEERFVYENTETLSQFHQALAQAHGFATWPQAYQTLWPYDDVDQLPHTLQAISQALVKYYLSHSPYVLGVRPYLKGFYYHHTNSTQFLESQPELKQYLAKHQLPFLTPPSL